jgi:hypothetical protein
MGLILGPQIGPSGRRTSQRNLCWSRNWSLAGSSCGASENAVDLNCNFSVEAKGLEPSNLLTASSRRVVGSS